MTWQFGAGQGEAAVTTESTIEHTYTGSGSYTVTLTAYDNSGGVLMVTHDLDSLYAICDRVAVLAEKRVLVEGPIEDMTKVDHPWVQEYFTGPRARAAQQKGQNR